LYPSCCLQCIQLVCCKHDSVVSNRLQHVHECSFAIGSVDIELSKVAAGRGTTIALKKKRQNTSKDKEQTQRADHREGRGSVLEVGTFIPLPVPLLVPCELLLSALACMQCEKCSYFRECSQAL